MGKIRKLPPEAFESDGFPGWEVSKWHYSPAFRARFERFIAEKRKIVERAKKMKARS